MNEPVIVFADGAPMRTDGARCPGCGAGRERRDNRVVFGGGSRIVCTDCGHHFEGETEC